MQVWHLLPRDLNQSIRSASITQRDLLFHGPIELAAFGIAPIDYLGNVAGVDILLGHVQVRIHARLQQRRGTQVC
uniref:Uncharacterized protein n=1 Tax=Candidatus Kentrum sp. LFY TaxID=2126342 RepID=A0A450V2J7_9GAMM|nr:MAG: hypothetical protein BECKLFY1418B_GA0070995_102526 [Candidatus Kentron sp. LFY]VFJ99001.1 MAG: hypothetical protein BECKLFY1418A_GA0070994_10924 [Candidatus Kentron sp. LFY]VFK16442.1 MAG: hypothetical protein BECKLFY1418C_GA0070996_102329 [Candidatus Kentron sp. LFY]